MLFLKFLDDYQQDDDNTNGMFSLFCQRLNERRKMTFDDLSMNPLVRFRQTVDLLDNQIKEASKHRHPSFSNFLKKMFQ